jgi:hypothetical protein
MRFALHRSPESPPSSRPVRWWRWGWCGWALLGLSALTVRADVSKEYQLKAAFLFNFTKFVEWPAGRFADDTSPIVIGVLGRNPFEDKLANLVKDRLVNGRAIVVRSVTAADDPRTVHVLFVPGGEEPTGSAPAWQNSAVLTVGESRAFAALGGNITFTQEGDKVRFEINLATAERDELKISAQLLKLATAVRRKP